MEDTTENTPKLTRVPAYLKTDDLLIFKEVAKKKSKSMASIVREQITLFRPTEIRKFDYQKLDEIAPKNVVEGRKNGTVKFINFYLTVENKARIEHIIAVLNADNKSSTKTSKIDVSGFLQYIINGVLERDGQGIVPVIDTKKSGKTKHKNTKEPADRMKRIDLTLQANVKERIQKYAKARNTSLSALLRDMYTSFDDAEYAKFSKFTKANVPLSKAELQEYSNPDDDPKGPWKTDDIKLPHIKRYLSEASGLVHCSINIPIKLNLEIDERIKANICTIITKKSGFIRAFLAYIVHRIDNVHHKNTSNRL